MSFFVNNKFFSTTKVCIWIFCCLCCFREFRKTDYWALPEVWR